MIKPKAMNAKEWMFVCMFIIPLTGTNTYFLSGDLGLLIAFLIMTALCLGLAIYLEIIKWTPQEG